MAVILVHKHTASARLNDYLYYLKILNAISLVIMATLTNIYTHTHTHTYTHTHTLPAIETACIAWCS